MPGPYGINRDRRALETASWRLRVHPTPRGDDRWHVIEQQAYANAGDTIESLDLLCSGFHAEQSTHD